MNLAADVATIQHIAHAWDATSNGVTLATRGRNCAGNATDHDMNSTIVVSSSRDVGVLEAMADLSDDIENCMRCTATEHASTQESHSTATEHASSYALTQSQHFCAANLLQNCVAAKKMQALAPLQCNQMNCYRAFSRKQHRLPATQFCYIASLSYLLTMSQQLCYRADFTAPASSA